MTALVETAAGVWVATSRRDLTTTTVIEADGTALLIDPAWEPDELATLAAEIAQRGWTITAGIASHAHEDHVLWHPGFGDVPRYASTRTVQITRSHKAELLAALGPDWPTELAALVGDLTPAGPSIPFAEPVELVVHDAHAPGHTAVWLPDRQVLVAGDMLSDVELPLPFDPDDLAAYTAGLDVLAPYVARAALLIPGHGHPTTAPQQRLEADRAYLHGVLSGDDVDDPRRTNTGMAAVHRRIVAMTQTA